MLLFRYMVFYASKLFSLIYCYKNSLGEYFLKCYAFVKETFSKGLQLLLLIILL